MDYVPLNSFPWSDKDLTTPDAIFFTEEHCLVWSFSKALTVCIHKLPQYCWNFVLYCKTSAPWCCSKCTWCPGTGKDTDSKRIPPKVYLVQYCQYTIVFNSIDATQSDFPQCKYIRLLNKVLNASCMSCMLWMFKGIFVGSSRCIFVVKSEFIFFMFMPAEYHITDAVSCLTAGWLNCLR